MRKKIHLAFFMGQSNMAGRGDAALAPALPAGMGWEFRAVSAPDRLFPMQEPFGADENDPLGVNEPGKKTGSMVSAFTAACTAVTGIPMVGVSCAKGGSAIHEWLPGTPYFSDALRRAARCRAYLDQEGYEVARCFVVWCQGCTDGDLHTPPDIYKARTEQFLHAFMAQCGAQVCFLVQIGNHRDAPLLYAPIQSAQEELAREHDDIIIVSRQLKTFAALGLMKDRFHYLQEGYNRAGTEAGTCAAQALQALESKKTSN